MPTQREDPLIRTYRPDDLAEVAQVWLESWNATGLDPDHRPSLADYQHRLASEAGDWSLHVALVGAGIGGFMAFQPAHAWLRQLFVSPARQGQGLGRALLDLARREMPDGFWLRTDADNLKARRFYERAGLVLRETGVHPTHGQPIATYDWRPTDGKATR